MTDEEIKQAIADAVSTETEKLKTKNSELIKEVRDLKVGKKTAEEEADDAKADADRKSGDIEALEKRLNDKFEKERNALAGERDTALGELKTLKIDSVISKALVDNNVAKFAHGPLTAMFKSGATLDGSEASYDGKPLADALKGYFGSEDGKHYVTAPNNSGGGATGSTAVSGDRWSKVSNDMATWTAKDHSDFAELAATNPSYYNSVVDQKGLPSDFRV